MFYQRFYHKKYLFITQTRCWFQKHIYQCSLWHWMSSYDITWHLMTADVIWWHQMSKIYWSTCFWNQHSISNHLSLISTKSKNVVEKIFFSSKGPPFGCFWFSGGIKQFKIHKDGFINPIKMLYISISCNFFFFFLQ